MPVVDIFCDGSVRPNPGLCGVGAILRYADKEREYSAPIGYGTNETAELRAAIDALALLKRPCCVTVYSDSFYLVKSMNGEWRKRKHFDLWTALQNAAKVHALRFEYVPGHAGHRENERAHQLAYAAMLRNE